MAIGQTAEGSGGFGPAAAGGQAGRVVPPGASRPRPSARERLLAAANELFYNEGVHTVGIDRVIEQAGVAKASLYNTFGSKDELVRAYLEMRHASVAQRITRAVERYDTPRERLLAVFEGQEELFTQPGYRGCAFTRAGTGSPSCPAPSCCGWASGPSSSGPARRPSSPRWSRMRSAYGRKPRRSCASSTTTAPAPTWGRAAPSPRPAPKRPDRPGAPTGWPHWLDA